MNGHSACPAPTTATFKALKKRKYIKDAIRRGLIKDITNEMIEEVDNRIQGLQGRLKASQPPGAVAASVLP